MTTIEPYEHLDKKAIESLSLSNEDRIDFIRQGTWFNLGHVKEVLEKLNNLLNSPKQTRMPCLLIYGPPYSGKTSIVEHFVGLNAPDIRPEIEKTYAPVVMVEAPPKPDYSDLYSRILDKLFVPYKLSARAPEKYSLVKKHFMELDVKVLIIDEIQHLLAGGLKRQQEFRNALKSITNETKVCIVAVGIQDALYAIHADQQLSSRFPAYELPIWGIGKELGTLLKTFEKRTPLKKPSRLYEVLLMTEIYNRTESNLGDIFEFLKEASIHAIKSGEECINQETINSLVWTPPSKRGKAQNRRA
ncbi:AAA family ATPase [Polynucleobacter paneuropaeus]|jgi:hypothetical protein|uniref:TniB family NTP-binding protein n=1 Tax=Polynucleobacter sp. MWH-Tro8-2-5-gr TaxID=1855606 RepID=UPI0008F8B5C0|nr:TniB family NTP-binding protein [Polynucleobacter sp. MWH-Tro8-2-5-gr]MBT8571193.1 AAA family ATPase [Polynucleobacter paneuropaeus]MBT8603648.1 AAA family ATPase [Polynucleobacter paneuropaeus]OIM97663.1 transposase [Polynucleobacter sp. MWH-Tro8-2-5-gr]